MTCAATSGYRIEYDNRHLWMKLKSIKASHFANYREAYEANKLIAKGMVQPVLSATYDLVNVGEAVNVVRANLHEGKVGIRCLSPADGLGISDPDFRARVGEDKITLFERFARSKQMEG
jgi:crotonyl-CoA reductase